MLTSPSIAVSWSGGKDSMLVLHGLLQKYSRSQIFLFCGITLDSQSLAAHGVPRKLLEAQANALGMEIFFVEIEDKATNEQYWSAHEPLFATLKQLQVKDIYYGDIYLEQVRAFKQELCSAFGFDAKFPLWGRSTYGLADNLISIGYKSLIISINSLLMPESALGANYDIQFVQQLPVAIDPSGENGEFHTFVYYGPFFMKKVEVILGATHHEDFRPAMNVVMSYISLEVKPDGKAWKYG